MRFQCAALVGGEWARGEPANGDAVESVAEDEVLGESVTCREERLFDLWTCETELGCRLVDPQAMQLPQHVDLALTVGQGGECSHERAGARPALR